MEHHPEGLWKARFEGPIADLQIQEDVLGVEIETCQLSRPQGKSGTVCLRFTIWGLVCHLVTAGGHRLRGDTVFLETSRLIRFPLLEPGITVGMGN